nr:Chain A, CCA-adding enzyme [Planococcus halocryophilus]6Q52_A Chain A, CCA-adding enzyme [Planococcus halocryophilus]6QXN_A Chain A, CCA-adding enzyme [Planococcus halocryophilus]6QY6_A Chain A, CCA-adding enzyme [Planococcus halocryophilus]6TVZ_A Chain A, CCA-adding enzyme [Planococcus halocryophilus]7OQX_A Chain A, CCA-adding enzyme [Planococcus halocryophilus]7OTL_A Chain A, CCA-adding enzyme [Planococcus halocryophilus]
MHHHHHHSSGLVPRGSGMKETAAAKFERQHMDSPDLGTDDDDKMNTAIKVIHTLKAAGFEAYIVGGAVRDLLLGKTPHDVDVASSALPQQVKVLFDRTVDTGIDHGTVLVLLDGEGIEVTTFRTESSYSDNRRPDSVEFVLSLEEDLRRRDFTINAMAMTEDLKIIDPFGGKEDLKNKVIRAVGDPDERFEEDALRMLRAIRFSGQLDFIIDMKTLLSIRRHARLIRFIAVERLKSEIDKIFVNPSMQKSMAYLKDSVLTRFLPVGGLFEVDWITYHTDGNPTYGWLYLLHQQKRQFTDIKDYRFSNEEKRLIEKSLELTALNTWDQWTFYKYTLKQLEMASRVTGKKKDLAAIKRQLPIQSRSELAVDGWDLIEWSGAKSGPWLKVWIEKIERLIVYGILKNDKELIKDWFEDEYHSHT